nr:uncharacterized protein LOC117162308 [Bombus vancouverensis nearcticus]
MLRRDPIERKSSRTASIGLNLSGGCGRTYCTESIASSQPSTALAVLPPTRCWLAALSPCLTAPASSRPFFLVLGVCTPPRPYGGQQVHLEIHTRGTCVSRKSSLWHGGRIRHTCNTGVTDSPWARTSP